MEEMKSMHEYAGENPDAGPPGCAVLCVFIFPHAVPRSRRGVGPGHRSPQHRSPRLTASRWAVASFCRSSLTTPDVSTLSSALWPRKVSCLGGSTSRSDGRFDCETINCAESLIIVWVLKQVVVGTKTFWDLGVVRESANRKGMITSKPENGYWMVRLRSGK